MSFYLANELQPYRVTVNVLIPGHTRGSWFDETVRARIAAGQGPGRRPVRPDHVVPLALFLASSNGAGVTGNMFDIMQWNKEHGLGDYEHWAERSFPPDLEEAFQKAGA